MSPEQAEEKLWPEVAVQLLQEIQDTKHAIDRTEVRLSKEIADLRTDVEVNKVKAGYIPAAVAAVTTLATLAVAWMTGYTKGG